ncbi:hypothetical protein L313_0459 [Acinetobacter haemolyticus CIP 64.3 = MTCC 9819]|uniref:Uncharacterized protein n=1 Tax=Acinetobacter haemolyticus CIP 64.3 = MTCC 9819 TaxID=1217659 RepID=N9FGX8_ACIHA|nr:hypothetical protein [Acinetobacter haemolyticus]ENW22033.1 hypothetical protein F927_00136 [Acinetobacter haemolyticus CIP 64.3 = MTCC 9819]EPR87689.1 hypothetical protein L313_0459 [Acinetobacter haemolyticus CIP 64.3 = MTCC 9819]QXZ28077.1 hypothetical protein I6L22_07420 [Acinetobacter haemolyticus]SPT49072.1 Uncharacterised protein [Acinetobacter haemolyticus]SUU55742.1 Uncharacterised protein [Acinetobacter haemolyticus]
MFKFKSQLLKLVLSVTALSISMQLFAGRPMHVDDASVVDAKSCQLEMWMQKHTDDREYWSIPACNFGSNFELALGMGRTDTDQADPKNYAVLQGKTLLKALETNSWGIGLATGSQFNVNDSTDQIWYISVPASLSTMDDAFIVHANLGWSHEKQDHRNFFTWGVGSETQVAPRLALTTELYGNDRKESFVQTGFRYMLRKDRIQLDTSYGKQLQRSKQSDFFSLGLVLYSSALLP